jgi:hypothetical protein
MREAGRWLARDVARSIITVAHSIVLRNYERDVHIKRFDEIGVSLYDDTDI